MDGWMKARHWIPRVMDFLWTFAVAIVGVFPERWVPTAQKTFSLRHGFSPCSSDGIPLSLSDEFLPHQVTASGGDTALDGYAPYPSSRSSDILQAMYTYRKKVVWLFSCRNLFPNTKWISILQSCLRLAAEVRASGGSIISQSSRWLIGPIMFFFFLAMVLTFRITDINGRFDQLT
jgi:hypothetical protein